tara:strand:- start:3625 stop:3870 length:246 start_codon:yes stop_codon:yes gene_type:complete
MLPMKLENKKHKTGLKQSCLLLMMLLLMLAPGCKSLAFKELNGIVELTEHPQFPDAAKTVPEWTKAALKKVAELEYEIERN